MKKFEKDLQKTEEVASATLADRKKVKQIVKLGMIALVLCACIMIYNISGCQKSTADDIYTFEGDSNYQISEYQGKIFAVSYGGIKLINFDGKQTDFVENHMSSPHYNISGDMILLYDRGNKKLAVYEGVTKKYSYECDQPIKSAKVNKNGYVVLISDEVAYNSKVIVLDDKGKVAYIWKIGNEYIVDADISPDNKKLVAATLSTDTGAIIENIVFVDINAAEETGRIKSSGDMPLYVKFVESGSAIAVSDTKLCAYDIKAKKKWSESFGNNMLQSFEIAKSGNVVVALRGIKNNTIVRMYTKNGHNSGEYVTQTQASYIDTSEKSIAVCEKSAVTVIDYSGKLRTSVEIKKEIRDIAVVSDDKVLLLCDDCIQLIKI